MIQLKNIWDYVYMLWWAAAYGAIGGLVFELIKTRFNQYSNSIEWPHLVKENNEPQPLLELGFISSMILGAVASVAVLYFFEPVTQSTVVNGNVSTIVVNLDFVKLVALSLIVGSAGPIVLTTIQTQLVSALKLQNFVQTALNQTDQAAQALKQSIPNAVNSAINNHLKDFEPLIRQVAEETPPGVVNLLKSHDLINADMTVQDDNNPDIKIINTTSPENHLSDVQNILNGIAEEAERTLHNDINQNIVSAKNAIINALTVSRK